MVLTLLEVCRMDVHMESKESLLLNKRYLICNAYAWSALSLQYYNAPSGHDIEKQQKAPLGIANGLHVKMKYIKLDLTMLHAYCYPSSEQCQRMLYSQSDVNLLCPTPGYLSSFALEILSSTSVTLA